MRSGGLSFHFPTHAGRGSCVYVHRPFHNFQKKIIFFTKNFTKKILKKIFKKNKNFYIGV